jgi:hypothetical protein
MTDLYDEVERLAAAMYRGDRLIVSARPDALAQATERTIVRLRDELESLQRAANAVSERAHDWERKYFEYVERWPPITADNVPTVAALYDCIGRPATVTVAPGVRTGVLRCVKGSEEPVEVTVALDIPRAERPQDAPTSEEPPTS